MRLDEAECWARLETADHGVFGTVHAQRGVDIVPVVFAVFEDRIVMPIDTVKPKRGQRLQRLANVDADPRCVLLVEHYDEDWSRLWWVRVHGSAAEADPTEPMVVALADRYPQYRTAGAITRTIILTPRQILGWAALPPF